MQIDRYWSEVRVQTDAFELAEEERRIRQYAPNAGALVIFQGMVREFNHHLEQDHNPIEALFLEHYPEVTEAEITRIIETAAQRWDILAVQVIHRVGKLYADEVIVLVSVCAEHRTAAFAAAEFVMDYLKTQAPFWKREHYADGAAHWVPPKASDQQALQNWQNELSSP